MPTTRENCIVVYTPKGAINVTTVIPWNKHPLSKENLDSRKDLLVHQVGTLESRLESTFPSSLVVRKHLNPPNTVNLENIYIT